MNIKIYFKYLQFFIICICVSCTSIGTNKKNTDKNEQIKDTANPLTNSIIRSKDTIVKNDSIAGNDQFNALEKFINKKKKSQKDFDGFFDLLLTTNLSDLGEEINFYLESVMKKKADIKGLLFYASIYKDSAKLNKALSDNFSNIYYIRDENLKKEALRKKIEEDFSFNSKNYENKVPQDFVNELKKKIFSGYFKSDSIGLIKGDPYIYLEKFIKKKKKRKQDFDGFFDLMLTTNLSDLGEDISFYLESVMKKKAELQELLFYARIYKDSVKLKAELSDDFCNIYYMHDENLKEEALQKEIEKDFSFNFKKNKDRIPQYFINELKKKIYSCYVNAPRSAPPQD